MVIWSLKKLIIIARHSILLSFLLYVSACLAIFLSMIFYNWYLPKSSFRRDVDLEIQNTHYNINSKDFIFKKELIGHVYLFDSSSDSFQSNQEYTISLIIDLPESDINFDVGMFGIQVDIQDLDGRNSFTFKTIATLNYKSLLLRYITTVVYFPYYMLGRYEQKQTLNIVLKDNFVDNPYMPAHKFTVKIDEKIQFYSITLLVQAKLSGLKYMLHNWFYVTSTCIFLMITFSIFLFFLTAFYGPKALISTENLPKSSSNEIVHQLSDSELYSYNYYKKKLDSSEGSRNKGHEHSQEEKEDEEEDREEDGEREKNKYLSYS